MLNNNLSNREISLKYNCNEITIRRFINKEKLKTFDKKRGRPKKLTKREENYLVRQFSNREITNTTQGTIICKEKFSKKVGNILVRNRLKENGFKSYKIYKKPNVPKANKKKRLFYYYKFKNLNYDEF